MAHRCFYPGAQPLHAQGRWNPCCRCFFGALPDDLVLHEVFRCLSLQELGIVSQVCTRFNYLCENPCLYNEVTAPVGLSSGVGLNRLLSGKLGGLVQTLTAKNLVLESSNDGKYPLLRVTGQKSRS